MRAKRSTQYEDTQLEKFKNRTMEIFLIFIIVYQGQEFISAIRFRLRYSEIAPANEGVELEKCIDACEFYIILLLQQNEKVPVGTFLLRH